MTEISSFSLLFWWFGLEHADILFLKKGIWNCESETDWIWIWNGWNTGRVGREGGG